MNRHVNAIAGRLSLRPPQRRSCHLRNLRTIPKSYPQMTQISQIERTQ
jgi:hypothetical protein